MKAEQFTASYDKLKEVVEQQKDNSGDLRGPALAIFGMILGAAIVGTILGDN